MCCNPKAPCDCLASGSLCDPCMMTAKDTEIEAAQLPDISTVSQPRSGSELDLATSTEVVKETGQNWGWTLSGFICLNILMLGCCLVSSSTSTSTNISFPDLEVYLILLVLLTAIWMVYYTIYTTKNPNAATYRDEHAGPIWLRGKKRLKTNYLRHKQIIGQVRDFSCVLHVYLFRCTGAVWNSQHYHGHFQDRWLRGISPL